MLPPGTPVAVHPTGIGFLRASAADNNSPAIGVLAAGAGLLAAADVTTAGVVTLADWSAVAGSTALSPRAVYYLGTTSGTLTTTPPALPGQAVQAVGRAVSPTALDLTINDPILL